MSGGSRILPLLSNTAVLSAEGNQDCRAQVLLVHCSSKMDRVAWTKHLQSIFIITPALGCQSHKGQLLGAQKHTQVTNQIAPFRQRKVERSHSLKPSAFPAFPSLQPLQTQQQSPTQQQVQGKQSQPRAAGLPAGPHSMATPAASSCAEVRAASRSG